MKTIFEKTLYKVEIERSKFIGYLFHIENVDDLKPTLKEINKEFPKATHYCYAYSINGKLKSNDDGEPSGTAGNPILEAITQNSLDNICIVVIRYFGGIKLGAGGLTRAYLNTALSTIKEGKISEIIDTKTYLLKYDYTFNTLIQRYIKEKEIKIIDLQYDVQINCSIATNENINELIDMTNGKIIIEKQESTKLIK